MTRKKKAEWKVENYRQVERKLPIVYECPNCGMKSVRLQSKDQNTVVSCSNCSITVETATNKRDPIDIFNEFFDKFNAGQLTKVNS
jgi:transcription elongation factor Elf1